MATRGRIGLELADESILSVYCHFDNYPEFNGVKLVENFNTREKVKELIDGGDISSLWTNERWSNDLLPTLILWNGKVIPITWLLSSSLGTFHI
jgi:hypothetical protein